MTEHSHWRRYRPDRVLLVAAAFLPWLELSASPGTTEPIQNTVDWTDGAPPAAEPAPPWPERLADREFLLGDIGGLRGWLGERGVSLALVYTADLLANLRGGIQTSHASEYRADLSLFAEADTEQLGLWGGGTFFVHFQHEHGDGVSERHVGDVQLVSNIDAEDFTQLSELWFHQVLFDGRVWMRIGKQEANRDFAAVLFGGEFIHSSAGAFPTVPLATFPDQDWGVVLGVEPLKQVSLHLGVYQGRPNGGRSPAATLRTLRGPMLIAEPALHYDILGHPGHLRAGIWWNGDRVARLDSTAAAPGEFTDRWGWYATFDLELWRARTGDDAPGRVAGAFAQFGRAQEDRSEAALYAGGGVECRGFLPGRPRDVLGLGSYNVRFSDEIETAHRWEHAFELFYRVEALRWLALKPDLQWVIHPGGSRARSAVVAGVRVEVVF